MWATGPDSVPQENDKFWIAPPVAKDALNILEKGTKIIYIH